ncbi:hypothetical protein RF11_01511 [Thelohanellus kitauei]|uniref:Uncharacterized protein n=1 Tax=Thelohanellus kitauei TaxID=669202 RepID=A0A0C2IA62_THEKT|nr:hypothetical protein RF11_01511 [Thelohanellus kitauei]
MRYIVSIITIISILHQISSKYYDEKEAKKLLDEWNKKDPDYDESDDDDSANIPDDQRFADDFKNSKMIIVNLKREYKPDERELLTRNWAISFENMQVRTKNYDLNATSSLIMTSDTNKVHKIISFFKKETTCLDFVLDDVKYKCAENEDL